jgi:chromosome segregation ATPase
MINRDEYLAKLKAQLQHWDEQLGQWEVQARMAQHDAKVELERQIGIMRSRADDLVFRMGLLKDASAEAWHEIQHGADEARKAMHDAFEKAQSRLKDV